MPQIGRVLQDFRTVRRIAVLCAVLLLGTATVRADAVADYNLAVGLYKQSRWALAAQRFEAFLKTHPQHERVPLAKFYLGLAYVNQEDYKAARDVLRNFVKTHADDANIPQARYRIAECSYLLDDLPAALPELQDFVAKHPQHALMERALPYLGDAQLRQNEATAALATFDKAIQDFPKGALTDDARFGRARALEILKRPDESLQQYRELAANKESPRAPEALFQIAARQFDAKQFAESAATYDELIKSFPQNGLASSARLNTGYALYQAGKFGEAAERFAVASQDARNSLTAAYWQGLSLKAHGDVKQAATVLATAAEKAGDAPLAESINFQRALCARQLGDTAEAVRLFTTGADQWPKGETADDCLHAAAELALDHNDLANARLLLNRFAKDYPGSGLRLHYELLMGRVDLAEGTAAAKTTETQPQAPEHYRAAADRFDRILRESTVPRTQSLARYYLGLARQLQGQHDEVLKVLTPLTTTVLADGAKSEFGDALIVLAESQLALKQDEPAQAAAGKYATLFPQGRQSARALYVVAVAAARRQQVDASNAAQEKLIKDFRTNPIVPVTLLQLAEIAESQQDWVTAAARYSTLIPLAEGTDNQAFAIRGLAWSLFKQKKFAEAADEFGKVLKQFPEHKLVSECAYYRAEALREAGQPDQALAAYAEVLAQFGPATTAAAGAEEQAPLIYAYRAGLQRARTYRQLNQIPQADEAYAALLAKFPQPKPLDKLLDEWALMNYEAENYARADEIFARLVKEAPDSDLADNAALSLAESDLVNHRSEAAQQAFTAILASGKSDADVRERALYQLIVLAVDQQRWAEVNTLADRLAKDFPESSHLAYARYSQAEAVLNQPKPTEAQLAEVKQRLDTVMTSAPEKFAKDSFLGRAWVLAAEIAYREKRYNDVIQLTENLKQRHADSIFIYQIEEILGRSYKQQPDFAKAREAFERVLADPQAFRTATAAKCQFLLAETYFLEDKWTEAFLEYQKVYTSYDLPEWQAAALLQSGKCDEQLKQWKEAATSYAQLLKEFPKSEHAEEAKQRLDVARKRAAAS